MVGSQHRSTPPRKLCSRSWYSALQREASLDGLDLDTDRDGVRGRAAVLAARVGLEQRGDDREAEELLHGDRAVLVRIDPRTEQRGAGRTIGTATRGCRLWSGAVAIDDSLDGCLNCRADLVGQLVYRDQT